MKGSSSFDFLFLFILRTFVLWLFRGNGNDNENENDALKFRFSVLNELLLQISNLDAATNTILLKWKIKYNKCL